MLAVCAGHRKHIPGMSRTRQICGVRLSASGYSGVLGPGITEPGRDSPPSSVWEPCSAPHQIGSNTA